MNTKNEARISSPKATKQASIDFNTIKEIIFYSMIIFNFTLLVL